MENPLDSLLPFSIPWQVLSIRSSLSAYHGKSSGSAPAHQHTTENPLPTNIPWQVLWIHPCLPAFHEKPSGSTPVYQHTMKNPLDPLLSTSIPWQLLWIHSYSQTYHGKYHGSAPAYQHTFANPLDPLLSTSTYHGKPSGSAPVQQHTIENLWFRPGVFAMPCELMIYVCAMSHWQRCSRRYDFQHPATLLRLAILLSIRNRPCLTCQPLSIPLIMLH